MLLLTAISLHTSFVQNAIARRLVRHISIQLDTVIEIDYIRVFFPRYIHVSGLYVEDLKQDTLWYSETIDIELDMLALLRKRLSIYSLSMENVNTRITRSQYEEYFNYQFIVESLIPEEPVEPYVISVYDLYLRDVDLRYFDEHEGDEITLNLELLSLEMDLFDLENLHFSFELLDIHGVHTNIVQSKPPERGNDEVILPTDLSVSAARLGLHDFDLVYHNRYSGDHIRLNLSELAIQDLYSIVLHESIEVSSFDVSGAEVEIRLPSNDNDSQIDEGIDFSNLRICNLNIYVDNLMYREKQISTDFLSVSLHEHSGLTLDGLAARVHLSDTSARFDSLRINTGFSRIQGDFHAQYPALEIALDNPGIIFIDLSLRESYFGFDDALLLYPQLSHSVPFYEDTGLTIWASVKGDIDSLVIDNLEAYFLESTYLNLHGNITGITDLVHAVFNVNIVEFTSGKDDFHVLFCSDELPLNIKFPPSVVISGTYTGSIYAFDTELDLLTTFGSVTAKMKVDIVETENYNVTLAATRFDLGKLLDIEETVGAVSFTASVDGSGFDIASIDSAFDMIIEDMYLLGYNYNGIGIEASIRDKRFTWTVGSQDPNLRFAFDGDLVFADEGPILSLALDLEYAGFHALTWLEDDITAQGMLWCDLRGTSLQLFEGKLVVQDVIITNDSSPLVIDSLIVTAIRKPTYHQITIRSEIVEASYEGNIDIVDLPVLMMSHVDRYFSIPHEETVELALDPEFEFSIRLLQPELITDILLPDLNDVLPAQIEGVYQGEPMRLYLGVDIPSFSYRNYAIDSLTFHIESDRYQIEYSIQTSSINISGLRLDHTVIRGTISDDIITNSITVHDKDRNPVFSVAGLLEVDDALFTCRLLPDTLVINYEQWSVHEDNYIRFGPGYLFVDNLRLSKNDSRVVILSIDDDTRAPPVEINVHKFDLSSAAPWLPNGDYLLDGSIDIEAHVTNLLSDVHFDVEALIDNLIFNGSAVGNVGVSVVGRTHHRYDLEVNLVRHGNQLHARGYILTAQGAEDMDIEVDIQNINLASMEGFAMGQVTDMDGSITGHLHMSGSLIAPNIDGFLRFQDALFTITAVNTRLRLADEVVEFDNNSIVFREVALFDSRNNSAIINGNLHIIDFSEHRYELDIVSTDFMLMDLHKDDHELFFGRIIIDSDIRVRGSSYLPVVNADVGLKEGTDLTVIVPFLDPVVIEREGIVEFVVMNEDHESVDRLHDEVAPAQKSIQGIDLSANIDVDSETRVQIVIDEQAGDYLSIRGGGVLIFGIDTTGLLTLAGRYELMDGYYQMTFYEVARRRFDIRPGSNIVWTGDPFDAEVDINAYCTVWAQTSDLLEDYTTDARQTEFRRLLPYEVILYVEGYLLGPDIRFAIDMPQEHRGALGGIPYEHIQMINENETERIKQVFSLLVLNRFLPENPFDLGEGPGITSTARTSASRLLTQQLNVLSRRYVRGLDIRFDVESYEVFTEEGPEGRTELELQVSRRFLDDRIIVEIGGEFDLEGERAQAAELADIAADISIDFMITEDGRYRVRGFRKTELGTVGEGEIISTGLSLLYVRDYARLANLYRTPRAVSRDPD